MKAPKRFLPHLTVLALGLAALGGGDVSASPQAPRVTGDILFSDNFELPPAGPGHVWTTSMEAHPTDGGECPPPPEWHITTSDTHSGSRAWTNDPYTPAIKMDPLGGGICFNHLTSPPISTVGHGQDLEFTFWEHKFTEGPNPQGNPCNPPSNMPPCDFGFLAVSNDDGATWKGVVNPLDPTRFEGGLVTDPYALAKLDVIGGVHFAPGDTIRLRLTFSSDAFAASPPYGPFTGWYVDDVMLCEGACPAGTTAVRVASFTGRAAARSRVELTWRTASEVDALGFNVWRSSGGKAVKVHRNLVPARAVGRAGGATYRLVDRSARRGAASTYRLEVVGRDGTRAWRASTKVSIPR